MQLNDAARAAGVATGYHDIWGHWHESPTATLQAALEALGHPRTGGTDALVRSVQSRRDAAARRLVPATVLVDAGMAAVVRLNATALAESGTVGHADGRLRIEWTVSGAGGQPLHGACEADPADPRFGLPPLEAGRYRLSVRANASAPLDAAAILLAAPGRCHLPAALRDGGRRWGIAVQLYGLQSRRNWGIGDFTDLRALVECAAALGAGVIGLNPLHALPLDRPEQSSPYAAVSRLFLNPLYIDPERIDVLADPSVVPALCARHAPEAERRRLRATARVDHAAVARLKLPLLRAIYDAFVAEPGGGSQVGTPGPRGSQWHEVFAAFVRDTEGLRLHATWQSIQCTLHAQDPSVWGWPCWPAPLRDPAGAAVERWQQEHAHEVGFHAFLEWQASRQWQQTRTAAAAAGVLLYGDLALGADRGGSEVWAAQDAHALSISAGCPPDDFNLQGQDWGLPPLRPDRLAADGCEAFRAVLAASMARFDALRLDHVMALMRLFWIPPGPGPAAGAYVDYPFDAMLATLRIESVRHGCMVIGEDLGTVPPAVREGLSAADVLSYRLLVFERDGPDHFRPPQDWPRLALASVGSHDLSPLQGWWAGDDLGQRLQLGLLDADQHHRFSADRSQARWALLRALADAGLLPEGLSTDPGSHPTLPAPLVAAVHAYLARTGSMLAMVNPEDVFELVDATNLPGTTVEHPNWSRRLPVPVEDWAGESRWHAIAATQRDRSPTAPR